MKKNIIYFIALIAVGIYSCELDSDFNSNTTGVGKNSCTSQVQIEDPGISNLDAGMALKIINQTSTLDDFEFEWEVRRDGNLVGTFSTDDLTFTFNDIGDYTIILKATCKGNGAETTDTISLSVIEGFTVDFEVITNTDNCPAACLVEFKNLSSAGVTSFSWDFGDGGDFSSDENPTNTYNTAGIFTITLTASVNSVERDKIMNITIRAWQCGDLLDDNRDGLTYRTVWIDNEAGHDLNKPGTCWMVDNLERLPSSRCFENTASNCNKYGRMYERTIDDNICPIGWRISTNNDWFSLFELYGFQQEIKSGWTRFNTGGSLGVFLEGGTTGLDILAGGQSDSGGNGFAGIHGAYWAKDESSSTLEEVLFDFGVSDLYYQVNPGSSGNLPTFAYCRCIKE